MDVGIYYCKFGCGHQHAAQTLLKHLQPYSNVVMYDVLSELWPETSELIYKSYAKIIRTKPAIKYLSQVTSKRPSYLDLIEKRVLKTLEHAHHDVFIATYSMAAYFLARYKRHNNLSTPLVTCITDFTIHDFWINDECDLYLVISEHTKAELISHGVPADKIVVYSLYDQPQTLDTQSFDALPQKSIAPSVGQSFYAHDTSYITNATSALINKRLKVLISGGGLGLLPERIGFYQSIVKNLNAEVRVICGKNAKLKNKLLVHNLPHVTVYGFVNNMDEHLEWADCYVGKPGGMSVMEAISTETPILYLSPVLSQEKGNARFITSSNIGCEITARGNLTRNMRREDFFKLKSNMQQLKRESHNDDLIEWITAVAV